MNDRIHFRRGTLAEYETLLLNQETDPDTLYFCSESGKGFCIFLGDLPLFTYKPPTNNP